ncbi:LysR substrate-binding domain-containing protein [Halorhodospira halophila]|uniref:Transcriptional regulator n=1 Tax=Halorhodospira halophila (strain DSM 244 / SL1) TaxID=349124 RepID=A1WXJ9_HALHL|nr:LysR substrate-binding domain-containing protein [Halorhodospira halophila]ABM62411.1 transcriptional regulator [Halorhodospira halophila SL1]MBK1729541.1 LysR family transcriptional regulator [Halorhodospira halophila]
MKTRILDLTLLQTFVTVVEQGGFTAAGEQLHLAQSTVSAHITRLEEMAGHRLLRRDQRRLATTTKGERLLAHARRLLQQNALAWQELQEERLGGRVRLGIPDDYIMFLPESLSDFEARYPGIELEVSGGLSVELIEQVQSGQLDLAVVTRQPKSPGGEVLRREPLIWAAAADYAAEERDPLPLALSRQGVCTFREQAVEALEAADFPWRIAYTSTSLAGLRAAVRSGLAVTVLTPSMLDPDLRTLGPESGLPELPSIELALHRGAGRPSEPARQLFNTLQERLGNVSHG